jgi:hypothetical protein
MSNTQKKKIALYASIVIGAGSGPFLFRAAGISDFPKSQISHYMIVICYVAGAMKISMFILLKLLSAPVDGPTEEKKTAENVVGGNGG